MIGKHARLSAQRRDGREFPISISFSVAEIRDNLYFTGIIRDITEYKEMEDRVLHTERLAAVGNTMTHIAHEIKNPLLIIGGFARELIKVPDLDDKSRRKLSIIAGEVSQLEEMVAEMREFVRRPPAVKRPGQIGAALSAALELFQDTFKEHNIQVRRVEETPLPPVNFDPRQLHQVLINLLKNALEAMHHGGEITITSRVKGANAEISHRRYRRGYVSGGGGQYFSALFYHQGQGNRPGTGHCQAIIQEHGGVILVESTPGKGTTFTIQLPLTRRRWRRDNRGGTPCPRSAGPGLRGNRLWVKTQECISWP